MRIDASININDRVGELVKPLPFQGRNCEFESRRGYN